MRVFVFYPQRTCPGGGHKQMRLLVRNFCTLGAEAYLLPETSFDDNVYYSIDVPLAPFPVTDAEAQLATDDVLLLPEINLEQMLARVRTWPCRKGVYAQGGFLALRDRPRGGYARNGIELMIAVSPYIAALGHPYLGLAASRAFHVPYPVLRGPFAQASVPAAKKRLAVCCMPRKLPEHIASVRRIVAKAESSVPWVEIRNADENEVARSLSENAVFFSTQNGEGFGLPAIEAMSRGCIVAGYAGTGGFPHPYANTRNGLWARDRSIRGAARQVLRAIQLAQQHSPRIEAFACAARETLSAYTPARAIEGLVPVLEAITTGSYPRRGASWRSLGVRGHLQACRVLRVAAQMRRGASEFTPAQQ